jgi:hypothetical protein
MSQQDEGAEPGPLGEEAAKLIEAAQEWWARGPARNLRVDRPALIRQLTELQGSAAVLLRGLADIIEPAASKPSPAADSPRQRSED